MQDDIKKARSHCEGRLENLHGDRAWSESDQATVQYRIVQSNLLIAEQLERIADSGAKIAVLADLVLADFAKNN